MSGKRGLFIATEGIDGSGKSTQARMLADWLRKKGEKIILTYEPYSKHMRKILREKKKQNWLRLFTDDRNAHLKKVVIPALKNGKTVICDRYYYSTLAYQHLKPSEWGDYASKFLKPDIALIFDVPADMGLKRVGERDMKINQKASYFEKKRTLERVRKRYLMIPRFFKEANVIDASKPINTIFQKVKKIVKNAI
jgi:dTMP kinase